MCFWGIEYTNFSIEIEDYDKNNFLLFTLWTEKILAIDDDNNNNNSQCGSRFRGVWGDPAVGNLTSTDIRTHRETDSKRPTKTILWKSFIKKWLQTIYRGEKVPKKLKLQEQRANKQGAETYLNKPGALEAITAQPSTTCRQAHKNPPHPTEATATYRAGPPQSETLILSRHSFLS